MRALVLCVLASVALGCTASRHELLAEAPVPACSSEKMYCASGECVCRDTPAGDEGGGGGLGSGFLGPQLATKSLLNAGLAFGGLRSSGGGPNAHAGQDVTANSFTATVSDGSRAGITLGTGTGSANHWISFNGSPTDSDEMALVYTRGAQFTLRRGGAAQMSVTVGNVAFPGNTVVTTASSKNHGTITLSGGTGTATVDSSARCVCTDTTANASVKCATSGSTLTATGTGTDVIAYLCL